MAISDPFTTGEYKLAEGVPLTPAVYAAAQIQVIDALDWFGHDVMVPVLATLIGPKTDREEAISGTFYRLVGYIRSVNVLREPRHFQAVAACSRALFELAVDIALIHKDLIPDGVDRFHAFTRIARYRSAQQTVEFYKKHPELKLAGDGVEQATLLSNPDTVKISEAIWKKYWPAKPGKKKNLSMPSHWSGRDLQSRAALVGTDYLKKYRQWTDLFAWYIHAGPAGVGGMSPESLGSVSTLCRQLIAEIVPEAYRQTGVELQLHKSIPEWGAKLEVASQWALYWAVTDVRLQTLGYPSKLTAVEEGLGKAAQHQ